VDAGIVDDPNRAIRRTFTSVIDMVALDIDCSQREIDARPLIAVMARRCANRAFVAMQTLHLAIVDGL
jgi:hypothetical protein